MRINFVCWSTSIAGGNRAIFEAANRLKDRGYHVEIIALGGDHRWFNVDVEVRYVPISKSMRVLFSIYRIAKLRRRSYNALALEGFAKRLGFHADLIRQLSEYIPEADVHIATYYPTALSLYLSNTKSHRLFFLQDFPELVEEVDGVYGLKLFELSLRLPFDVFLCNSSYTRSIVEKVQPNAKTIVTGAGVDLNIFKPRRNRIIDAKGRKIVMFIARGSRFKGDHVAVQALNIIAEKLPIHAIIVINDRSIADKLFSTHKPRFTYTLFKRPDDETLAKLYSSADVFIFTSYAEGFGLPPLEAMASGTPVVTTDCKGNRDYVRDGYNALVVPPGDPMIVANAVLRIFSDDKLRERLVEEGLETAKQWTWERVVDKFEEAIRGCNYESISDRGSV